MLLQRRGPRQQLRPLGLCQLFGRPKRADHTLQDDAPALGHVVIIGLEKDVIVDRCAHQLGALRSADEHSAVLNDEVDWKDLGLTVHTGDEPPESDASQQVPAFARRQNGDGMPGLRYRGAPRRRGDGSRVFVHSCYAITTLRVIEAAYVPNLGDFRPCQVCRPSRGERLGALGPGAAGSPTTLRLRTKAP